MPPNEAEPRLRLVIAPLAADDLREAFVYIAREHVGAARHLRERLLDTFERLREYPMLGAPLSQDEDDPVVPGVRVAVVEPYLVFYRPMGRELEVLRVLHTRRDALGELLE